MNENRSMPHAAGPDAPHTYAAQLRSQVKPAISSDMPRAKARLINTRAKAHLKSKGAQARLPTGQRRDPARLSRQREMDGQSIRRAQRPKPIRPLHQNRVLPRFVPPKLLQRGRAAEAPQVEMVQRQARAGVGLHKGKAGARHFERGIGAGGAQQGAGESCFPCAEHPLQQNYVTGTNKRRQRRGQALRR